MTPAVRRLCAVDVRSMVEWISAIPFEEWPQQTRLDDGRIRPAMVNDLDWPRSASDRSLTFRQVIQGGILWDLAAELLDQGIAPVPVPASRFANHMLSVVMPGHSIPPHADRQSPGWLTRVHVPLLTNPWAFFDVLEPERRRYQMEVGQAYLVDVQLVHEVCNNGRSPRIHFMFDVFGGGAG